MKELTSTSFMYNEKRFLSAIKTSFENYVIHGSRSTEKIKPVHAFFADALSKIFGKSYQVHYDGEDSKEMKVEGKYYPKNVDMTVTKGDNIVFCLGLKFVTSNYSQNANNYFENMMGETANIQSNDIPYAQIIILRHHTPYYNKEGELKKIEIIDADNLNKHVNLANENEVPHKPCYICIFLIDIQKESFVNEDDKYHFDITKLKKKITNCPKFEVKIITNFDSTTKSNLSIQNLFSQISSYQKNL